MVFVGIDGASWKLIGPMIERGELPAFSRLVREGAYAPAFDTMWSTKSPRIWTTVATGRMPAKHGITGFTTRLPGGKLIPVTSNTRKVKALWNVAGEHGHSTGVIGWWASWPAEPIDGYVVSDHANPAAAQWMLADGKYWTADERALRSLRRDVHPPDLEPIAARHWLSRDAFPFDELRRRSGLSDEQMQLLERAPWYERSAYSWFKTFFAVDYPLHRLAMELGRTRPVDLQMIYFRAMDPVQHYAWDLVEPERYHRPPEHLDRDRGLVEGVYRYVDSFLGEILEATDESTTLIVASDHGSEAPAQAARPGFRRRPGEHTYQAKGVLFIRGPHVTAGLRLERGGPLDLAPTMAWLLGLPISEELPGKALYEAFDPDFVAANPALTVASYGERAATTETGSSVDDALLDQLRSLGYLE